MRFGLPLAAFWSLSIVVICEVAIGLPDPKSVPLPPLSAASIAALPDQNLAVARDAMIRAHPVFTENRRAPPSLSSPDQAADQILPHLMGIMTSTTTRSALFSLPGELKPVLAKQGEELQGWEIETIATDHVRLRRDADIRVLAIMEDKMRPQTASAPTAPRGQRANPNLGPEGLQ